MATPSLQWLRTSIFKSLFTLFFLLPPTSNLGAGKPHPTGQIRSALGFCKYSVVGTQLCPFIKHCPYLCFKSRAEQLQQRLRGLRSLTYYLTIYTERFVTLVQSCWLCLQNVSRIRRLTTTCVILTLLQATTTVSSAHLLTAPSGSLKTNTRACHALLQAPQCRSSPRKALEIYAPDTSAATLCPAGPGTLAPKHSRHLPASSLCTCPSL